MAGASRGMGVKAGEGLAARGGVAQTGAGVGVLYLSSRNAAGAK